MNISREAAYAADYELHHALALIEVVRVISEAGGSEEWGGLQQGVKVLMKQIKNNVENARTALD